MARVPWLIDNKRIAAKILNPSYVPLEEDQKDGATRECPNCNHQIDNSDLAQKWPGLPAGVKFDPSDQELLCHLAAKVGLQNTKPDPFIEEFIPTVNEDDGICYTHPEKLPGIKYDGNVCHFFHRTTNAYLKGNRKRRRINCDDNQVGMEVRWHKTGKTRPVIENGIQKGWKKIMVLYWSNKRGEKSEKTSWVMHQYHLGTEEDEKDNQYVVSKIFYQQQSKQFDKNEQNELPDIESIPVTPGDPVTPLTSTPELPRLGNWCGDLDTVQEEQLSYMGNPDQVADFYVETNESNLRMADLTWNDIHDQANVKIDDLPWEALDGPPSLNLDDSAWLTAESQQGMDSQQALNELYCNENLQNSSHQEKVGSEKIVPGLVEHGRVEAEGTEDANAPDATSCLDDIELDTPPDEITTNFDLQFNSQESLSAWANVI